MDAVPPSLPRSRRSPALRPLRARAGFTLVELLLVVAIMGIAALVAVPYFVRSIRGNRLRVAARSIVSAGRYARVMAVLHQRDIALTFQTGGDVITVRFAGAPAASNAMPALDSAPIPSPQPQPAPMESPDSTQEVTGVEAPTAPDLSRKLDGVVIASLEIEGEEPRHEGDGVILYRLNGTCVSHTVKITDSHGGAMTIAVDPLSSAWIEEYSPGGDGR